MKSSARPIGPWRSRPCRRAASFVVSAPASKTIPSAASSPSTSPALHLPPGAWAVCSRQGPRRQPIVLVVDGTNFAAIAYRQRRQRRDGGGGGGDARQAFARWLGFLSAAVGSPAATVVAFDNKDGEGASAAAAAAPPINLQNVAAKPSSGWDAGAAAAFVSGGGRNGGKTAPATVSSSGGAHLLPRESQYISLVAPPGQTADDAIADLCRELRRRRRGRRRGSANAAAPAAAIVVASSDRDMLRLVAASRSDDEEAPPPVYFLELVAGARGEASPLRLHAAKSSNGDGNADDDAVNAAAMALAGSRKHGVPGLGLPGITSHRSAAALVRRFAARGGGGGGLEGLLSAAAEAALGGEADAALRALADPRVAQRARQAYEVVRMGGRDEGGEGDGSGGDSGAVRAAAEEVRRRIEEEAAAAAADDAAADADADADADATARALFPPFMRRMQQPSSP